MHYYYLVLTPLMVVMFIAIMFGISRLKKRGYSYSKRVLIALAIGILFGLFIHFLSGTALEHATSNPDKISSFIDQQLSVSQLEDKYVTAIQNNKETITKMISDRGIVTTITGTGVIVQLMEIVSGLYIALLKLLVVPLILVSITTAIIDGRKNTKMGKKIGKVLAMLMVTVAIAAIIGIIAAFGGNMASNALNIDNSGITENIDQESKASYEEKATELNDMSFSEIVLSPVPTSFGFLTDSSSTAALSTVLFGMFLGFSIIQVDKRKPEKAKPFIDFLDSFKAITLSMVLETLKLTPYAVVALMAALVATTSLSSLGNLLIFVIATYIAIIAMYLIHLLFISSAGLSPLKYAKKTWEVLVFGFTSRSSMASLPLNVRTQTKLLGVDETTADISGGFGVTVGQNGCAGIYPAMVVVMTWLAMGHDITIPDIVMLIIVIMISSFGIAGVGGGASFAAVAVLSIMGLPVYAAVVLVSIEPLLDMARTALNISGSMTTGVVVAKLDGDLDEEVYNA